MDKINKFGCVLKEGDNLSVLKKAKWWFKKKHNVDIIKYFYSRDYAVRPGKFLSEQDLKKCEICGNKLYDIVDSNKLHNLNNSHVKHKSHLVFLDSLGSKHKTCYQMNWCFKRVGEVPDTSKDIKIDIPTFEKFVDIQTQPIPDSHEEMVIQEIKQHYNKHLRSFLLKWSSTEITKTNVLDFIKDLDFIEHNYLNWFEKPGYGQMLKKIYNFIGIYIP